MQLSVKLYKETSLFKVASRTLGMAWMVTIPLLQAIQTLLRLLAILPKISKILPRTLFKNPIYSHGWCGSVGWSVIL